MTIIVALPMPPSINAAYGNKKPGQPGKGRFKTKAYTDWVRFALVALVGEPRHSNAWGALIRTAKGRNLIENTGRYVPMRAANSHARITPVYRVVR